MDAWMRGGCDEAEVWMRRIPKLGCDAWMRCSCDEAGVEVGCDRNSKLGFRSLDATKPAWRCVAIEIRILDSEAWMRGGS